MRVPHVDGRRRGGGRARPTYQADAGEREGPALAGPRRSGGPRGKKKGGGGSWASREEKKRGGEAQGGLEFFRI